MNLESEPKQPLDDAHRRLEVVCILDRQVLQSAASRGSDQWLGILPDDDTEEISFEYKYGRRTKKAKDNTDSGHQIKHCPAQLELRDAAVTTEDSSDKTSVEKTLYACPTDLMAKPTDAHDYDNIQQEKRDALVGPDGMGQEPIWATPVSTRASPNVKRNRKVVRIDPDEDLSLIRRLRISSESHFQRLQEPAAEKESQSKQAAAPSDRHSSIDYATEGNLEPTLSNPVLNFLEEWLVMFIPRIVWTGRSLQHRYQMLDGFADAVNANAASAIALGQPVRALEWLEASRSIVWSQLIQLRTPLNDLRQEHPSLADKLEWLSQEIDSATAEYQISSQPLNMNAMDFSRDTEDDTAATRLRTLAKEYDRVLAHVRTLDGFKGFLSFRRLQELAPAAKDGPVVMINVHGKRCDALALCPSGTIIHVPLPLLSQTLVERMRSQILLSLHMPHVRERGTRISRRPGRGRLDGIGRVLGVLWSRVVQPILQAIEDELWHTTLDTAPRITWCATGPLAFLPLHAAGIYRATAGKDLIKASDFVVSSYTTSIATLQRPRQKLPTQQPHQILVVSQPATPDHSSLPGTVEEAKILKDHFPDQVHHLNAADATVDNVLAALNSDQYAWVHLACHGVQDAADPTQSAFALHDGMLPLSALMARPLKNAEIAVLSACQTATGDTRLAEEAVHLAGGMLGAGFRSIMGTLWSIGDEDATTVVDEFYANLKRDSKPAYALYRAVERLREKVGEENFERWVPYVHFGQ